MTTERNDGHGPYVPPPPHVVRDIAVGGVTTRASSMPLARELLHLRERTATLELQLNELEVANSRLEGDALDLHEKIDEWKAASGLGDYTGDLVGIEPQYLIDLLCDQDRTISVGRHLYASTALARDAAAAKVVAMERLEVWLRSVPIESSTNSVAIGLDYANDGNLVIGLFDEDGDLAECSAPTLPAAIDAALREVES